MSPTVGVLGLQGDVREHLQILRELGVEGRKVRTPDDLAHVDGLILPGGESTTLVHLMRTGGLERAIVERGLDGMPLFGTCAGMIVLAKEVLGGHPESLGLIDIVVDRNAYGRQVDSFEADLDIVGIGNVHAIFIRAPKVTRCGPEVEVLGEHDGAPVVVRQGRIWASSFHPELMGDTRIHRAFLKGLDER